MAQTCFMPLGGVRQIGANLTYITHGDEEFIIDAGILFPHADTVGIDYLIPDWSIMRHPRHLFLTHGHEDHIGAIGHLIEKFPQLTIHAAPFTAALVQRKLAIYNQTAHLEIWHDETLTLGPIQISPIKVNHSIPQTRGFLLENSTADQPWCLFYVSDFKIDPSGKAGTPFDLANLQARTKNYPLRLLMADSTNPLASVGPNYNEGDLYAPLKKIIASHHGRIFVTLFASNIYRLQTLIQIAQETSRTIIPYGRSINAYLTAAQEVGLLEENLPLQAENHFNPQDPQSMVLLSGPHGDLRGALRRVASGESPFKLDPTDTFIFSSKIIPGNERKVYQIINRIAEKKCAIYLPQDYPLHASGHATQDDFVQLLTAYQPTDYIPIHGESHSLQTHYDFVAQKFPALRPHLIHNFGQVIIDEHGQIQIKEQEEPHPIFIASNHEIEKSAVSERKKMATRGVIVLTIDPPPALAHPSSFWKRLTKAQRKKQAKPKMQITLLGLPGILHAELPKLENAIAVKWRGLTPGEPADELTFFIKRFVAQILDYRPLVVVHFTTAEGR